jgi:diguanylate cyclase (GGDEF)-like protein
MIIAIDIDHFKQINDRWGHATGDDALVGLARTAKTLAEPLGGDVARMGGDEFLVLLPNRSELDARSFANHLRKALAKIAACEPWTISLGLAQLNAGEPDYAAAARRADVSLYQAKHQGRDRVAA